MARVPTKTPAEAYWELSALRLLLLRKQPNPLAVEPFLRRRLIHLAKETEGRDIVRDRAALRRSRSCRRAYLRGVFLARGYVAWPVRTHHLEIVLPTQKFGVLVQSVMSKEGMKGGLVSRRSSWVVYLKDADSVAEFLGAMGASEAMLEYEGIRARKSLVGQVHRLVNMEGANLSRSVDAAVRQLQAIDRIDEYLGLERLPKALRDLSRARVAHPDVGMEELGRLMVPPLSKSAVNHRFRRISNIAGKIALGSKERRP